MKNVVRVIAGLLIAFVLGALVICAVRPVGRKPVIPVIVPPRADSTPAVIGGDDEELVVRIPIRIPVPGNYVPGRDTVRDTLVVTVKKRRVTVKPVEIVENPVVMVRPPAVIAFSPALYVGAAYPIGVTVKDCQGFRVSAGVYARVIRVWKFGVGGYVSAVLGEQGDAFLFSHAALGPAVDFQVNRFVSVFGARCTDGGWHVGVGLRIL